MEIILREFTEPTNIYICGCYFNNIKPDIMTDDDENITFITDGESIRELSNTGNIFILTDKELKENLNNMVGWLDDTIQYIDNYIGKITLCLFNIVDFRKFNIEEFTENIDLNDYILHQLDSDDYDFCLKLDYGDSTNLFWHPFSSNTISNLK